jgi:hypothetical protein
MGCAISSTSTSHFVGLAVAARPQRFELFSRGREIGQVKRLVCTTAIVADAASMPASTALWLCAPQTMRLSE